MSRLQDLFDQQGQSPWFDPTWSCLRSGRVTEWVHAGVRGVSATPSLFERLLVDPAMQTTDGEPGMPFATDRLGAEDLFWELTIGDVVGEALSSLRPLYERSEGRDGFAVIGLPPGLASDAEGAVSSARALCQQIRRPNLMVAIPATDAGISAIRRVTAEGMGVNPTLIFSLRRYEQVIDAYMSGLEVCPGDLSGLHSVASFPLGELDSKVDADLRQIRHPEALALRGRAACAVAKEAYRLFRDRFSGPRWKALADRGANVQRPLWVAASPDGISRGTRYADSLIGADTVSAMPEDVLDAFENHGKVSPTLERGIDEAAAVLHQLRLLGVDLDQLAGELEDLAMKSRVRSYHKLLETLGDRTNPDSR